MQDLFVIRCRLCPKTFAVVTKETPPPVHTNRDGNYCWGCKDPGDFQCMASELPEQSVAWPENLSVETTS